MKDLQRWLPGMAFVWTIFFALFALFTAPNLQTDFRVDEQVGTILFAVLLGIGLFHLVTVRFLVLPVTMRNPEARKDQVIMIAYMFAVAPVMYGLVLALFTGQGLLALPFSTMAFLGLAVVWIYLQGARRE